MPPTAVASTRATQVPLSASGGPNGAVTVNPMFLPAGTYLVTFTATVVNFSTATDYFRCTIYAVGVNKAANAVLLGPTVGPVVPMTVQAVVTLTSGGTAAVGSACQHDTNLPTGGTNAYYLDPGATLTAVPIVNGGTAAP